MLKTRVVKIYQQAQSVQNATQNMVPWRLQWEDAAEDGDDAGMDEDE